MRVVYIVLVGEMPNQVRELPNFVQKQVGWPEPGHLSTILASSSVHLDQIFDELEDFKTDRTRD